MSGDKQKLKVKVVNSAISASNYLAFMRDYNVVDVKDTVGADLVILPGGPDIHPEIYDETTHKSTSPGHGYFNDYTELAAIEEAMCNNIPILGICRGAQMLCVAAGGKLVQDIPYHKMVTTYYKNNENMSLHSVQLFNGNVIKVNSTHHQMMYPFNLQKVEFTMLGWASEHSLKLKDNKFGFGENVYHIPSEYELFCHKDSVEVKGVINDETIYFGKDLLVFPEIVKFHTINGLGIQYHPERMLRSETGDSLNETEEIVEHFLDGKI